VCPGPVDTSSTQSPHLRLRKYLGKECGKIIRSRGQGCCCETVFSIYDRKSTLMKCQQYGHLKKTRAKTIPIDMSMCMGEISQDLHPRWRAKGRGNTITKELTQYVLTDKWAKLFKVIEASQSPARKILVTTGFWLVGFCLWIPQQPSTYYM
jgi:hypothetical protein